MNVVHFKHKAPTQINSRVPLCMLHETGEHIIYEPIFKMSQHI